MPRTKSFKTKEEAVEAWNTWAGGTREITQSEYNELNDSIPRDYPIENDHLVLPDGEHAFGDLEITELGNYESPWPRIYFGDYGNAEAGVYGANDIFSVYKLRSRWRLVNKDHTKLKAELVELIGENDRDNTLLNGRRKEWNIKLRDSGFPLFDHNDLRGVDLSGQTVKPLNGKMTFLRRVDLSFAECHLLHLRDANLYEAKLTGVKGVQFDLSRSLCHGVSFAASYLPGTKFVRSDLGFAKFTWALVSLSNFNGANCHAADFSSSMLRRSTFEYAIDQSSDAHTKIYADLKDVKWDSKTAFEEVAFNEFLSEQNKPLYDFVTFLKSGRTATGDLLDSISTKPGAFGFSVDLRKLGSSIRNLLRRWKHRS
jgi:uncharacterized protein YjbI with pentapeptide repeats